MTNYYGGAYICHFHLSVIMLRQEFCISSGFAYYYDDCDTQEKLKTILWTVNRARNSVVSVGARIRTLNSQVWPQILINDFFSFSACSVVKRSTDWERVGRDRWEGEGERGGGGGKFALTICVFVVDCQMMTKYSPTLYLLLSWTGIRLPIKK